MGNHQFMINPDEIAESKAFQEFCQLCETGDLLEIDNRLLRHPVPAGWLDVQERFTLQDRRGRTPLIIATEHGHQAIAERILAHGANVNMGDASGTSPLSWAAFHGRTALLQLFLSRGAEPNGLSLQRQEKRRALMAQQQRERGSVGEDLRTSTQYHTPLHCAARTGNVTAIRELLEYGADPFLLTPKWQLSATFLAAQHGFLEATQLMVERYPETVRLKNVHRDDPMMWATASNNLALMQLLQETGSDFLAANLDGCTPLLFAVRSGARASVKYLLYLYQNVDVADNEGRTPLMEAAALGHVQILRDLLLHAADFEATDRRQRSAITIALRNRQPECFKMLQHAQAAYREHLLLRCWKVLRRTDINAAFSLPNELLTRISYLIIGQSNGFDIDMMME